MVLPSLLSVDFCEEHFANKYSPVCSMYSDLPNPLEDCYYCGKKLQDEYFIFSYLDKGKANTFYADIFCGGRLLFYINQPIPPKFNPFLDEKRNIQDEKRVYIPHAPIIDHKLVVRNFINQEFLDASGLFLYIQHPHYDNWVLAMHGQCQAAYFKKVTEKIAEHFNDLVYTLCIKYKATNLRTLMQNLYPNQTIKHYEFPYIENILRNLRIVSFL